MTLKPITADEREHLAYYINAMCDNPDADLAWVLDAIIDAGYNIVERQMVDRTIEENSTVEPIQFSITGERI